MNTVSEKDAILRERAAFVAGFVAINDCACDYGCTRCETRGAAIAAEVYSLPKVTRPRVVRDETGSYGAHLWRVVGGHLQSSHERHDPPRWQDCTSEDAGMYVFAERVHLLADLLANPTEEVEA